MALIGWLLTKVLLANWLPAGDLDSCKAGLILLGAAPCTAMMFVWSKLCKGNANLTLTQVAIALQGFDYGDALATVVGVLIEVPVMLWPVRIVHRGHVLPCG